MFLMILLPIAFNHDFEKNVYNSRYANNGNVLLPKPRNNYLK